MSKSDEFIRGWALAEAEFYRDDDRALFANPFPEGSDAWEGFEEAVYTFTQK